VKDDHQKKLVVAIISDEGDLGFIREIFADKMLKEESRLVIYVDPLEAALSIGKEKPDLLLIKVANSNGNDLEFGRKISSTHSDIKVIFMSDASLGRDEKEGDVLLEDTITIVGRERLHGEIINALGLLSRG
jgi:two-component SAPR family response regulator